MSSENDRESYLRWQELAITQLGYTINLFLTLGGAAISLALKILMESKSPFPHLARCFFYGGLFLLLFSVAAACLANVTRAFDFRYTRRAARERMKNGTDNNKFHEKAERYGKWTWGVFYAQAAAFGIGPVLLALSILMAYGDHL